jgi:hypothetical protein
LLSRFQPGLRYSQPSGLVLRADRSLGLLATFLSFVAAFVCGAQCQTSYRGRLSWRPRPSIDQIEMLAFLQVPPVLEWDRF